MMEQNISIRFDDLSFYYSKLFQVGSDVTHFIPDAMPTVRGVVAIGGAELAFEQKLNNDEMQEIESVLRRAANRFAEQLKDRLLAAARDESEA